MKKGKMILPISIVLILMLGLAGLAQYTNHALAKNKAADSVTKVDAKANMSKYTFKGNNNSDTTVRKSRLSQMNIVSEAAKVLNVLPIDIINEMKKGKSLAQVAKGKGLTEEQFLEKLVEVENKIVDGAVKDGTITTEHAGAIKQGQKDRLTKSLDMKAVDVNDHMAMDMGN